MKTFKTRLISAIGAAAMIIGVPLVAGATYTNPSPSDVTYSLNNITVEASEILALASLDAHKIKVVEIEDILTGSQLVNVKNILKNFTIQLQLLTLHNVLNNAKVLDGSNVLTFGDILSGNDVDMGDVISADHFNDGGVLVFCCKTCK